LITGASLSAIEKAGGIDDIAVIAGDCAGDRRN
jgi:hypothetical protein